MGRFSGSYPGVVITVTGDYSPPLAVTYPGAISDADGTPLPAMHCKWCGFPFHSLRGLFKHLDNTHPDKRITIR